MNIIGATAHYVTEDLDEGPIIEQDVERVSYRYDAADLTRIGRDIERTVLSRAVQWHLEDSDPSRQQDVRLRLSAKVDRV